MDTSEPLTRVQRRRLRNRELMLDAAERMVTAHGASGLRVEVVAEAADVSVGSIYTHFGNKDGLVVAVADRALERAGAAMSAAYDTSASPMAQVAAAGQAYAELLLRYPFLIRFIVADSTRPENRPLTEQVARRVIAMNQEMERRIDMGIACGEIRPLDARLLASFLFGAWNGVVALTIGSGVSPLTKAEARACLDLARRIVIDGIAAAGSNWADEGHPLHAEHHDHPTNSADRSS